MDEKLLESLRTIKAECKRHRVCEDCVMWSYFGCLLDTPCPCDWDIEDLEGCHGREKENAD